MRRLKGPRWTGIALLASLAAIGCSTVRTPPEVYFPGKPEKPRIKYVRSIRGQDDVRSSGWERIRRLFLGANRDLAVFNPTALALSPDDRRLYVSLTSSARVLEIDLDTGKFSQVANKSGHAAKQPYGLATDSNGDLYVADQGTKVVWVYSSGNSFVREIGRNQLERPTGIAIDRRRRVLYVADSGKVDNKRHQIEVFAIDGRHLRTIGTRGTEPGQFNFPTNLAVSRDGTLYVGDTLNFRIQMFDPDGSLMGFFGQNGDGIGGFNKIKGMGFDSNGLLYVADSANSIVQMFNRKNQLLMAFGGLGAHPALMQTPNGLAIDSKNNIYVADLVQNRINQYVLIDASDPEGPPPERPAAGAATAAPSQPEPSQPVAPSP